MPPRLVRECWPAVDAAAKALLAHGILTGKQLKRIVNDAVAVKGVGL